MIILLPVSWLQILYSCFFSRKVNQFHQVRGIDLPINVDGVLGAITADMDIDPKLAKAIFVFGRIAGLTAHYFEEINTQPQMRSISFDKAVYRGQSIREIG